MEKKAVLTLTVTPLAGTRDGPRLVHINITGDPEILSDGMAHCFMQSPEVLAMFVSGYTLGCMEQKIDPLKAIQDSIEVIKKHQSKKSTR